MQTQTVTLPADYATCFINGDFTGIETDHEVAHVESIMEAFAADGWDIVDCEGEPYFTNSYHLHYGYQPPGHHCLVTGGDVLDYTMIKAD